MTKNFIVKYTLIIYLLFSFLSQNCHAFDLDETVDDEIRKNYNPSKLVNDVGVKQEEDLPTLPAILKKENQTSSSISTTVNNSAPSVTIQQPVYSLGTTKVKSHTSFPVTNVTKINDWLAKGNSVTFKTTKLVNGKGFTIPQGTIFKGSIVDVHQPQITCNGGLVVVKINSMSYNGQTVPVNAYVTRANDKVIFLNNIKGDRTYLKTMWKKGNWGRTLFSKMLTLTVNLGGEGSTLLLSPFPLAYGTICLGFNALTSPICAFFSKGEHINIPAGSNFKIKLLDDAYIN